MQLTQALSFMHINKHFFRLLPLSCVLLTACVTTSQTTTKGTGSASDAKWKAHQQELSQLRDYKPVAPLPITEGRQKRTLSFSGNNIRQKNTVYC